MIQIASEDLSYIKSVATSLKVKPAALLAIIDVESNGVLFTTVNGHMLPVIRWEGHYFDRLVPADKRDAARKAGLASPTAGGIKNPSSQAKRYDILDKAVAIDKEAAYSSISIGIGQVMGAHWKDCGFASAEAMFKRACEGLSGQFDLMIEYIKDNDLVDELQRMDWSAFARGYNGPNYKQNGYEISLKKAFDLYNTDQTLIVVPGSVDMLRMGSMGQRVREVQTLLTRAGFPVKVDGDFGPSTKLVVKDFQKAKSLTIDGVVGPETYAQIITYKTSPDEKVAEVKGINTPALPKAATAVAAGGLLVGFHNQILSGGWHTWALIGGAVIMIVAVAWAYDSYQKTKRTYEGTV